MELVDKIGNACYAEHLKNKTEIIHSYRVYSND